MILDGVIERRLLINYRVDPDAIDPLLPSVFRPQIVNGAAVAGICLLRLGSLRPRGVPARMGLRSENVAHRIAVEWDADDGVQTGVYIPRRDSASRINVLVGGRLFPGLHHRATFSSDERSDHVAVDVVSHDGTVKVSVRASVRAELEGSHLFADLASASAFFERGSLGYSASDDPHRLDGLRLETSSWRVESLNLESVNSSFFEGQSLLDPTAADLDCGLIMRDVPVRWLPGPHLQIPD